MDAVNETEITAASQRFLSMGLQQWGQTEAQQSDAFERYIRAAGFKQYDADARAWVEGIVSNLRRGKFETEVQQLFEAARSHAELSS